MNDDEILKEKVGKVSFKSSNINLVDGFNWAKEQALEYAHFGEDPIGLWYEAALPERDSFCIRDVSHQSIGANILGLSLHTRNMLYHFVKNIGISRDFCTYWEITKEGEPTPVDYFNDNDFWYNLPANFDIIRTCYLQYLWTGDDTYINDNDFNNFYEKSVHEYIDKWDRDKDGIIEHYAEYGRRGIASYNEVGIQPLMAGDLIAVQYSGFLSYAEILKCQNKVNEAKKYIEKASGLKSYYLKKWWDEENQRFYGAMFHDKSFYKEYYSEGNFLPLFFGIVDDVEKQYLAIKDTIKNGVPNVEAKTYLPEIYYRYGFVDEAYKTLLELIDPNLQRREYPEVSYSIIITMVVGLMGIEVKSKSTISTLSKLNNAVEWAEINNLPILQNEVCIRHFGVKRTELTNCSGESLSWKASFPFEVSDLFHNEKRVEALKEIGEDGKKKSFIIVKVKAGEKHIVHI